MQVTIKGNRNKINLNRNHFISQGGEGKIYARKGTVFKIYTNPKAIIPYSKIKELSVIENHNVIKPEKIVLNNRQKPIGYTMKHISNTYALCQIFPKAFRDRTGIDTTDILKLVQKMQSTILDIHKKNILIVDLNEMNFLIDKKFKNVFFIDVDSYQTKSFPATAIMESIRDRHNKKFSELTDWFSFGIVSFQMFCSIHPYKGKHPTVKGLDDRMMQNIPVFHKDVRFPKVCPPFDIIPQAYKDWYKAIFFDGKRLDPPIDPVEVVIVPVITQTISSNESFEIKELYEYDSDIIKFISIDGTRVITTKKEMYINGYKHVPTYPKNIHVAIAPLTNKVISANIEYDDILMLVYCNNYTAVRTSVITADDIMSYDGRIYIKNQDMISEIIFTEIGDRILATPSHIANIMEKATKLFDGVAIQNVLGSFMISIFPSTGVHYQTQCPELQGYQIIDAKYKDKILIVIGSKKGKYDKFILNFDDKFSSYSVRKVEDISYHGINFAVLENGIVVHINENEEIEIFSNIKEKNTIKVINDKLIDGNMKLFNDGVQVVFSKGKKLYRLKMKGK